MEAAQSFVSSTSSFIPFPKARKAGLLFGEMKRMMDKRMEKNTIFWVAKSAIFSDAS